MVREGFKFNDTSAQVFHYLVGAGEEQFRTVNSTVSETGLTSRQVRFSLGELVSVDYVTSQKFKDIGLKPPGSIKGPIKDFFTPTEIGETAYAEFIDERLQFYQSLAVDLSPEAAD